MKIRIALSLLLLFSGCNPKPTESNSELFKLSGKLIQGGSPFAKATVSINNSDNLSTISDSSGYFEITNIPKGDHTLDIQKVNQDGSFYSKSSPISIQSDIFLSALVLPKGVQMYTPSGTTNSISLYWSATDANDFREYKVYRHASSGLDENTGQLIHVATAINDTSFSDNNIPPGAEYYYRVYVMNEFGRLGGSNIVKCSTISSNIVINGDFEEKDSNSKPSGWATTNMDTIVDFSLYSNVRTHSGNNAMKGFTTVIIPGPLDGHLEQSFSSNRLIGGGEYQFSFWYYVDSLSSGWLEVSLTNNKSSGSYVFLSTDIGRSPTNGWVNHIVMFTAPITNPIDYFLRFIIRKGNPPATRYVIWIDDVDLKIR